MRTDPVTLQIIANHTRAAAEGMAYTLYRTAHSTFVKETEDFTIQILDATGKTTATPMDLGATWYPGLDYGEDSIRAQPPAGRRLRLLGPLFRLPLHPRAGPSRLAPHLP